jgi:hypothetical protein
MTGGSCVPYTPEQKVARDVQGMSIPPFDEPALTKVVCGIAHHIARCSGLRHNGDRVVVRFTLGDDGGLTPLCVSPQHPHPPPNIFCAL